MLGAFDKDVQPKEPTYAIGQVTEKGTNLHGKGKGKGQLNHADNIDETRYHDIAKYLQDFKKDKSQVFRVWALGNYDLPYLLNWIVSPCTAKHDSCLIQGVLKQIFVCMNMVWWPNTNSSASIALVFQKLNNYFMKDVVFMSGQRRMSTMIKTFGVGKGELFENVTGKCKFVDQRRSG